MYNKISLVLNLVCLVERFSVFSEEVLPKIALARHALQMQKKTNSIE